MGWNDHLDDSEIDNLPPEAHGNAFDVDGPFDPNNGWLRNAEEEHQLIAMRAWFLARYCDPAIDTPYNGREGGYLFIHGGPYDPADELPERFSGIVDDDLIQQVVDEMHAGVGDNWAPVLRHEPEDEYDERFGLSVFARSQPLRNLRVRLDQARDVLLLQGDAGPRQLAEKLVFGAAISALEAFLWETAHFWVSNDEAALRDFVTKLPVLAQEQIKLGDIFTRSSGLKDHVKGYLQNLVWHRWDKVVPIFRDGLGVQLPSMKTFEAALIKRHDIVHRSGTDKDGVPISVDSTEINGLCDQIEAFAVEVDALLAKRPLEGANLAGDAPLF